MPFALVIFGLTMIVTGAKGTQSALGKQLVKDFTGEGNFLYWFLVIGALGALGSIEQLKSFSRAFMALVIVAMVLSNGGVFNKLTQAIKTGPIAPERPKDNGDNIPGTSIPVPKPWAVLNPVGALADIVKGVGNTATQSIATSRQQEATTANAFTRVLGFLF